MSGRADRGRRNRKGEGTVQGMRPKLMCIKPPPARDVRTVLELVMRPVPSLMIIAQWSPLERAIAYDWAWRVHLSASDNPVYTRPQPWFVMYAGLLAAGDMEEEYHARQGTALTPGAVPGIVSKPGHDQEDQQHQGNGGEAGSGS